MRPARFEYLRPTRPDEVCSALEHDGHTAILAGGQSLLPQLYRRQRRPELVVDIGRVDRLREMTEDGDSLFVGSAVTQRELERAPGIGRMRVLGAALSHIGHVPTRNRGTVGGSVAFADPSAEIPAVLLALDGRVHLISTRGSRSVEAEDLYTDSFRTCLEETEVIGDVEFPLPRPDVTWSFEQYHYRRHAKITVIAGFDPTHSTLRLTIAGAAKTPRSVTLDDVSPGRQSMDVAMTRAESACIRLVEDFADPYGPVSYRRRLVAAATRSAVLASCQGGAQ
ncbi:carbon-monoxide dehydrogenase medium subunit [Haloechinothrix alba]|uniref:Carbon-monoxide dehydrogenase medium subunit n=1 Tax=Haloechinothrix alba TaxID=664784 RepID=A0A239A069_9PSEU|nr:FAD binding domain-containing protein [Haloechinothrix alba]SNR88950.1 carbon-monoxide dehydrogenase medium subunit [Haloechinothrix alba]